MIDFFLLNANYSPMRQTIIITILLLGSLISMTGYYLALSHWIQAINEGVYKQNYLEAVLKTAALVVYTFLAVRFTRDRVNL